MLIKATYFENAHELDVPLSVMDHFDKQISDFFFFCVFRIIYVVNNKM